MALMAGFVLRNDIFRSELGLSHVQHALWLFMIRYISPLGILLIFIDALGVMNLDLGSQWPWLLGVLVAITLLGELISPRLRRQLVP